MDKNGMAEIVAKPGGLHSLINAKPPVKLKKQLSGGICLNRENKRKNYAKGHYRYNACNNSIS